MILIKLEQFLKVLFSIFVNVVGSVILFKPVHPAKASLGIAVIVLGNVILVNKVELAKPLEATLVTL